jgi:hypothetical protein
MSIVITGSSPLVRHFDSLFIPCICYIDALHRLIQIISGT